MWTFRKIGKNMGQKLDFHGAKHSGNEVFHTPFWFQEGSQTPPWNQNQGVRSPPPPLQNHPSPKALTHPTDCNLRPQCPKQPPGPTRSARPAGPPPLRGPRGAPRPPCRPVRRHRARGGPGAGVGAGAGRAAERGWRPRCPTERMHRTPDGGGGAWKARSLTARGLTSSMHNGCRCCGELRFKCPLTVWFGLRSFAKRCPHPGALHFSLLETSE